jgi:hypothetical protein
MRAVAQKTDGNSANYFREAAGAQPKHWRCLDHDRKDPAVGALQAGLRTPSALYSPSQGKPDKTQAHRTHETVQGVAVLSRARHSARSRSAHRTGVLLRPYRSMRNGFATKAQ